MAGLFFYQSGKALACANGAADILQAEAAITAAGYRFPKHIAAFDHFACAIADLARRTPHATATVASAFYGCFFLLTLFVLPHGSIHPSENK
ncbi:hypothetical protein [Ruegeria lacuscaerulensis]|uniref:hypothetical protein n=1 Tax=Ruegeria lacuscaerulensis TaxID=55218 RepID=UPI00147A0F80|nr:hypothetical protein [Ruegeria lacuscaerulensis]